MTSFDVLREAGGRNTALVKQFQTAGTDGTLTISLAARTGTPIFSGLEILAQPSDAANAKTANRAGDVHQVSSGCVGRH
jgi:hypothetical protein